MAGVVSGGSCFLNKHDLNENVFFSRKIFLAVCVPDHSMTSITNLTNGLVFPISPACYSYSTYLTKVFAAQFTMFLVKEVGAWVFGISHLTNGLATGLHNASRNLRW